MGRKPPTFTDASLIATELLDSGYEFDQGTVVFNRFRFVMYCTENKTKTVQKGFILVLLWIFVLCRSVISYKTDEKPVFSTDTVAGSGIVSLLVF